MSDPQEFCADCGAMMDDYGCLGFDSHTYAVQKQKGEKIQALTAELAEARAQLKAEQDANRKVVEKLCKAMGRWEGCWDNAAAERLAGKVTEDMIDAGVAALDHDPAISDESCVYLVLAAALAGRK